MEEINEEIGPMEQTQVQQEEDKSRGQKQLEKCKTLHKEEILTGSRFSWNKYPNKRREERAQKDKTCLTSGPMQKFSASGASPPSPTSYAFAAHVGSRR